MFYLDTSLLVAALTDEPRTYEIQEWLAAQTAGELVISDWVITEFSGALSLKVRTGQLAPEHKTDALSVFSSLIDRTFSVLPVSRLDFRTAARFADQYTTGLRSGDALHLALAANHGAKIQALDQTLVKAAAALGVKANLL